MTPEDATLDTEVLSSEARWSYYVTAYTMRDPTEGIQFSEMRMPFLKRNLPGKLEEDEEYERFYRRLQHYDGLVIRICASNYTMLYQPSSHDWFWRSTALIVDKDADAETIKEKEEELAKEKAAFREKRHDRFVEKFINNPNWVHGLSKDKVDESNQRFRSWMNGTLSADSSAPPEQESGNKEEQSKKADQGDAEMVDAAAAAVAAEPAAAEVKED